MPTIIRFVRHSPNYEEFHFADRTTIVINLGSEVSVEEAGFCTNKG